MTSSTTHNTPDGEHCGRGPCYLGGGHDGPCIPGGALDPRRDPVIRPAAWCDCGLQPEHLHDEDGVPYDPRNRVTRPAPQGTVLNVERGEHLPDCKWSPTGWACNEDCPEADHA